jgi:peroxiredoxin Q/BCP
MDAYRDQYATLFRDGRRVALLAVSVDPAPELASWARDRGYPFRFLSDPGGVVGRRYGAYEEKYRMDNRTLYVIGPDGRIAHVAAPFREIDPLAYEELKAAIDRVTP